MNKKREILWGNEGDLNSIMEISDVTHRVHPFVVGGNAGEDGGLPESVASVTGDEAGNTVHIVFSVHQAVERAARITLKWCHK